MQENENFFFSVMKVLIFYRQVYVRRFGTKNAVMSSDKRNIYVKFFTPSVWIPLEQIS